MRDQHTARHAAAVALYAKALAGEIDCSEEEQDTVHAAGLLHEIGKFTWPDRVLHARVVAEEDMATVRNHPQEGSTWSARSTDTARSPTRSSTTTSGSTAAATPPA